MSERSLEYRLKEVERELVPTGDDLLDDRRSFQAAIDALKLEVRALWRCLDLLHPQRKAEISALKERVLEDIDPEELSEYLDNSQ